MRAVVQRVSQSDVTVEEKITGAIGKGLMVLLGVAQGDTEEDARYLAEKIVGLRIFEDKDEKMNLSVLDVKGEILAVSQFTLLGDVRKGKRPGFTAAAPPDQADALYRKFIDFIKAQDVNVAEGVFQADMLVRIYNDGPVTILLDSRKAF